MSTTKLTNQQIADQLNEWRGCRRACVVNKQKGNISEPRYAPGDNPDLFPGEVLFPVDHATGDPWTATDVARWLR